MSIPIFDNATSNETSGYHYGWFHFALRERVRQANGGSSANMVMWRSVSGTAGRDLFDKWVTAYKSDTSSDPQRVKVLRAKPKDAVDGCYDKATPPHSSPIRCRSAASRCRSAASSIRCTRTRARKRADRWPPTS